MVMGEDVKIEEPEARKVENREMRRLENERVEFSKCRLPEVSVVASAVAAALIAGLIERKVTEENL